MITSLLPKQKEQIEVYKNKYIDKFFNNKILADKKKCVDYIHWFFDKFKISENRKPEVFLFDSPLAMQKAINYTIVLYHFNENLTESDLNVLPDSIEKRIWVEIENSSGFKTNELLRNKIKSYISNTFKNNTDNKLKLEKYYTHSFYLSAFQSWLSFFDFFDKEVIILEKTEVFNKLKTILDLNIMYTVPFKNAVFICRNAIKYSRNSEFELHSTKEESVLFEDGYKMFFVKGVSLDEHVFYNIVNKKYKFADFTKETNEEVKSAILCLIEEVHGSTYLSMFISENLKEIDTYVHKKDSKYLVGTTNSPNINVYTLFKGVINNIEFAYVRCYCPSTDRMFFLGCEAKFNNAKDAIGSLYRIPKKLKNYIAYIQRQGERFSTVFTEEGKKVKENLSEEDFKDLVNISGDNYFNYMRYEY